MADDSFWWIYLVFFMIPLARMLPRIIKKVRGGSSWGQYKPRSTFKSAEEAQTSAFRDTEEAQTRTIHEEHSPEKKVLGQMSLGVRDFGMIRDNLGMDNGELEIMLANLEKQGLMRVIKKGGVLGTKIELHITEDGIKRYHS
ncbi:MAG: hypothetical protein D9C04_06415 [Nitrosopumilus sp. B06]|nr:MAG: hypothetical protein EB828_01405 [Nitrosopumilus sp. D6]RNJ78876.1 MAG: hypothetical protein D9C04_06415 [Nitrosopumilus sp. B06]